MVDRKWAVIHPLWKSKPAVAAAAGRVDAVELLWLRRCTTSPSIITAEWSPAATVLLFVSVVVVETAPAWGRGSSHLAPVHRLLRESRLNTKTPCVSRLQGAVAEKNRFLFCNPSGWRVAPSASPHTHTHTRCKVRPALFFVGFPVTQCSRLEQLQLPSVSRQG